MQANPVNILKAGDKVICRDNEGHGAKGLIVGTEYTIAGTLGKVGEVGPFDNTLGFVTLEEDYRNQLFDPRRFSLVVPDDQPEGPLIPIMAKSAALLNTCAGIEHNKDCITSSDMVTLPQHYARFKIEPIRFICENGLNFFQANVVKYTLRHDAKNGIEDLKKAKRYLEMYIKWLEEDEDWWRAPGYKKEAA